LRLRESVRLDGPRGDRGEEHVVRGEHLGRVVLGRAEGEALQVLHDRGGQRVERAAVENVAELAHRLLGRGVGARYHVAPHRQPVLWLAPLDSSLHRTAAWIKMSRP